MILLILTRLDFFFRHFLTHCRFKPHVGLTIDAPAAAYTFQVYFHGRIFWVALPLPSGGPVLCGKPAPEFLVAVKFTGRGSAVASH